MFLKCFVSWLRLVSALFSYLKKKHVKFHKSQRLCTSPILMPHVVIQEHLAEERKELESQKETYQQDLERLRESTRAVEREKERLENQKKIKRKTIEVGGETSTPVIICKRAK